MTRKFLGYVLRQAYDASRGTVTTTLHVIACTIFAAMVGED